MPEQRSARNVRITLARDPLIEAFVELARSAIRNDREASERRAKMRPIEGGRRDAA